MPFTMSLIHIIPYVVLYVEHLNKLNTKLLPRVTFVSFKHSLPELFLIHEIELLALQQKLRPHVNRWGFSTHQFHQFLHP